MIPSLNQNRFCLHCGCYCISSCFCYNCSYCSLLQ